MRPSGDTPLVAEHPEIPAELALQGFDGVRAYSAQPEYSGDPARAAPRRHRAGRRHVGAARRGPRRDHRLRRAAGRARPPERGHGPSRRVGHHRRRAPALGRGAARRRRPHLGDRRPPLLPLDLLPRAQRRPVRDRRRRPRLHGRRLQRRGAGIDDHPPAAARAPARAHRGDPHPAARSARAAQPGALGSGVRRIAYSIGPPFWGDQPGNAPASCRRPASVIGSVTPPRQRHEVLGRSSSAAIHDRAAPGGLQARPAISARRGAALRPRGGSSARARCRPCRPAR